ncbi:hypothetical protein ABUK73_18595 [Agrobacterium sp. BA1120]|uniref:hypothetical protein n=1 Tax=Agrobacterium sp. BA1120 TaxID=3228927 RepID=UPI00336A94DD
MSEKNLHHLSVSLPNFEFSRVKASTISTAVAHECWKVDGICTSICKLFQGDALARPAKL